MRVIQTKNDTIRLIFNPKTDGLCLSDFLIVRDGKDNFLAQIIEIYDDKFNQEENVAVIKLVYRILPDYQVVPYDNFTPSRECEIAKIKPEEIEKCLNIDKTTVPFGISTKNNRIVNVNLDFFNNNPVVFADKLDEVNCAFENIAQKLKSHKKVVAIDYTGNLNIKNSKRIKALEDFKLPLDYYSLDYILEKALKEISLEAESELEDMFVELKKFVDSTEDKYIPFPRFIKVIEQQYKATPAAELKLLLTRLKRYWNEGLFSRSKKEFQAISKALQKEGALIIDFSNLKLEWHKEFLEFAIREIKDYDSYLLLRLNENNSNPELINNLYLKNPKINIISSISYGFVKMPQVMEHAGNYILYKTLNPRRDFGFANFQIAALNSSSFLIFGKDTMDFMFTLKNLVYDEEDLKKVEDKKIYIDLNLELEEMTSVELLEGNFDLKNVHIQNQQPAKNNGQKRLSDEVTIDDILPGYEQNQKEKSAETKAESKIEEAEIIAEQSLQDISPVEKKVENIDTNALEEANTTEALEDDNKEYVSKDISEEVLVETVTLDDNTDDLVNKDSVTIKSKPESETIEAEVIPEVAEAVPAYKTDSEDEKKQEDLNSESNVAELIEASLKNDEEYIKEISGNKEENEIPLNEDDLDYFVNPEATKEDEVITSEMITDAIDAENLAGEIEAQTIEDSIKAEAVNALKKNSVDGKEKLNPKKNIEAQTVIVSSKESEINELTDTKIVNPVASEPEMIKEDNLRDKAEQKESVVLHDPKAMELSADSTEIDDKIVTPEEKFNTNTTEEVSKKEINEVSNKEELKARSTKAHESETLENIKHEAHSVLEQESVQKVLEANLPDSAIRDGSVQTKAENQIAVTQQNKEQLPVQVKQDTQIQPLKATEVIEEKIAEVQKNQSALVQNTQNQNKKQNPDEAIIIVKEKPNLLIDDFTESDSMENKELSNKDESSNIIESIAKKSTPENLIQEGDNVSLKELAQKSIEARFDEVIQETKKPDEQKKKQLKINDNVAIDIDLIKAKDKSTQSSLPIFNNNEEEQDEAPEYDFKEGMKVSHEKYGAGNILKVVKYSNRCLLQIEFEETGKRLLDPKIARIKPVQ